jgi:hypothetical protein
VVRQINGQPQDYWLIPDVEIRTLDIRHYLVRRSVVRKYKIPLNQGVIFLGKSCRTHRLLVWDEGEPKIAPPPFDPDDPYFLELTNVRMCLQHLQSINAQTVLQGRTVRLERMRRDWLANMNRHITQLFRQPIKWI